MFVAAELDSFLGDATEAATDRGKPAFVGERGRCARVSVSECVSVFRGETARRGEIAETATASRMDCASVATD